MFTDVFMQIINTMQCTEQRLHLEDMLVSSALKMINQINTRHSRKTYIYYRSQYLKCYMLHRDLSLDYVTRMQLSR